MMLGLFISNYSQTLIGYTLVTKQSMNAENTLLKIVNHIITADMKKCLFIGKSLYLRHFFICEN